MTRLAAAVWIVLILSVASCTAVSHVAEVFARPCADGEARQ